MAWQPLNNEYPFIYRGYCSQCSAPIYRPIKVVRHDVVAMIRTVDELNRLTYSFSVARMSTGFLSVSDQHCVRPAVASDVRYDFV